MEYTIYDTIMLNDKIFTYAYSVLIGNEELFFMKWWTDTYPGMYTNAFTHVAGLKLLYMWHELI